MGDARDRSGAHTRLRREWLLASLSLLGTLAVLEAGCRALAAARGHRTLAAAEERRSSLGPSDDASLGDIVRPSRLRDVVYELLPSLHVRFLGQSLSTSAAGFRDRDYAVAKPPGTRRILGIGDSVMFGWGVADGLDYLSLTERALAAAGRPVEMLNMAVPGYNSVMEVATLRERGLAYAPDLVVVGLCGNDAGLPYFLQDPPEPFALDRSFLLDFVRGRLSGESDDDAGDASGLVIRPLNAGRRAERTGRAARVPPRYAHMTGLPAFRRAFEELRALSQTHAFEVRVLYYPNAPQEMREILAELGLPSVNTAGAIRRFLNERGGGAALAELRLSSRDPHPSAAGHRLIAEVLRAELEKSLAP